MAIHSIKIPLHSQAEVSYKKSDPSRGDFISALSTAQRALPSADMEAKTYVVQAGDSLYRIAQRQKATLGLPQPVTTLVGEMTSLNHLADPDRIFAGQVLRLPETPLTEPPRDLLQVTPPRAAVPNQDFPLFAQQENIILPSKIPASYFPRQDFPSTEKASDQTPALEAVADANIPGQLSELPPLVTNTSLKHNLETQIAMYKEDQLLAHPGGDYYFLSRTTNIHDPSFDQSNFVNRVGKDLEDTGENLLNIAKNLALGAEFKYVAENGDIKAGQRVGLLGTLNNFVEDVFSGLSFGAYVPDGEREPEGVGASFGHFFKKIFYDAPIKDLLIGIPHAAVNIVKDTALASLNLLEVIPDATIGNFEWGQKATTTVFDNGQVVIDYLTDVLPGGDAWLRVHAAGPRGDIGSPVYFNLMTSEQGITDSRWASVRNTHFRKTIETVGSLLSDAAVVAIATHTYSPSSDQRHD